MGESEQKTSEYDHNALMTFIERPDALDVLANIAYLTYPEDQNYTAESVNSFMAHSDFSAIDQKISAYMAEGTLEKVALHVLNNKDLPPIKPEETSSAFQDMVMQLRKISADGHSDMAKALMMFGVGIARYEYLDSQKEAIPYNEDLDEPIRLATPPSPEGGL